MLIDVDYVRLSTPTERDYLLTKYPLDSVTVAMTLAAEEKLFNVVCLGFANCD